MGRLRCCLLLILLCLSAPTFADDAPPRIGVVLGGGGARGFAHLGVLRELEKLHIPIACIAGTSAGALVGGMYANGLSLDAMQQSFKDNDWNAMLSGNPARSQVPYQRKSDDYRNYFDLTFGVGSEGVRVPRSAINAQDIDLYLRQMTRDRSAASFDQLPIPFRAVAADLSNGEAVVFDRGSLATALRASMAVPGLFDPVADQGRLLIDGGVARNLPIEDLKHRCADHVIVVDVGTPLMKPDQIHTLFDVLSQTSNLLVASNVRRQMALLDSDDVVIRPDLDGYTSASFADNQAIIARGEAAVQAVSARLKAWSVSAQSYQAWHARLTLPASPHIDRIRAVNPSSGYINPQRLAQALDASEADSKGDLDTARQTLRSLFASGDYDSLTYRLDDIDGRQVMQVMPVERAIGPNYLRFGMNLKSTTNGDAQVNVLASSLSTWVDPAGATWRNDIQIGSEPMLRTELYQPFGLGSPSFVSLQGHLQQINWPFYDDQHHQSAQIQTTESGAGLNAGVELGKYGQLSGGPYWAQYNPDVDMGTLPAGIAWVDHPAYEAGMQVSAVADQFDNPRWPRSGYFFDGNLRYAIPGWTGVDTRYYGLTADDVITSGDITWRLTGKLKGNLDTADPNHFNMPQFLGGFLNMSGYQQDELYGEKISLGRVMVYWRAASLPPAFGSGLYAGGSLELGKVWRRDFSDSDTGWMPGGSVFLGADTVLGPLFVGVGNARGGRPIGYMFLGIDY